MRFDGKIVLVTGAASGIGLQIARQFIAEGATVVGTDVNAQALFEAAAANPGAFHTRVSDAGNTTAIAELAQWVTAEYGALDVLVNNAGFARLSNPEQVTEEDYCAQMAVLFTGPVFMVKHFASLLRASDNGSVINISSASAVIAMPGYCPYGSAKAAIVKFSEDCALTVPGVRHNAVLPGFIDTPILEAVYGQEAVTALLGFVESTMPVHRLGLPEDVANAVLFLASDDASYITGVKLLIDGGASKVHACSALG